GPGDSVLSAVQYDGRGLADGTYLTRVRVRTNQPGDSLAYLPVTLSVGNQAGALEFDPDVATGASRDGRITAHFSAAPCDTEAISRMELAIRDSIPVPEPDTIVRDSCGLTATWDRISLLQAIPSGAKVALTASGIIGNRAWIVARDTISMLRPLVAPAPQ